MISRIDIEKTLHNSPNNECLFVSVATILNQLVDAVNAIQKEREAERFEIQEWIGIVSDLRSRVPVVESRVSILEEHAHPTATTEPADPYAEQRRWIGCLVRYKICDWQGGWRVDVLDEIVDHPIYPFKMRNGDTAAVCEVVEPSEIYPNKARTW